MVSMLRIVKKIFNSKIKWLVWLPILLLMSCILDAKIYVFVSHSMNNSALQQYYKEAQSFGATLVMRGLIDDSFIKNKEQAELLGIGYDIDPELFKKYNIESIPVIIKESDNLVQKITGHITLREALKIFEAS